MEYFLQQTINGVTLGAVYGLVAIGYTMVYGIVSMINFAHGEIYMIGAFIAVIAFTVMEFVILVWRHQRTGRGLGAVELATGLAPGLCLMIALRLADVGATDRDGDDLGAGSLDGSARLQEILVLARAYQQPGLERPAADLQRIAHCIS